LTKKNHQKHFLERKLPVHACRLVDSSGQRKRIKDRNWMRKNGNIRKKEKNSSKFQKPNLLSDWLTDLD